jgi:hypothetical protein
LAKPPVPDPFADFRASVIGASPESVFRLMPIESFARSSRTPAANGLQIAAFEYPRQCRIRRVRVLAPADEQLVEAPGPVIVSRRALGEFRDTR